MADYTETPFENARSEEKVAAGTSLIEGVTGLAAVALAIIGLAGVFPTVLLSIATIALGAALLFEAGSVSARFSALMSEAYPQQANYEVGRWTGMTASFLGGAAGIALGILSLLGLAPMTLVPIAVIVFGAALIMDSGVNARLNSLETERSGLMGLSREVARESSAASVGVQVLVGLSGVTLGILALVGISAMILSLIAVLSIGASLLLGGSIIGGRMLSMFKS